MIKRLSRLEPFHKLGRAPIVARRSTRVPLSVEVVEERILCATTVIMPGTANPYLVNPAQRFRAVGSKRRHSASEC